MSDLKKFGNVDEVLVDGKHLLRLPEAYESVVKNLDSSLAVLEVLANDDGSYKDLDMKKACDELTFSIRNLHSVLENRQKLYDDFSGKKKKTR